MQLMINSKQTEPLIKARFVFIALQLIAVVVSQFGLEYRLPFVTLYAIITGEFIVNLACFSHFNFAKRSITNNGYFLLVSIDIIFLTALLYFTGGAANPFVSLLLLPIAIAAVTLPKHLLLLTTLLSMIAYSLLLLTIDPHALHNMNMEQHLFGMWLNFILSAIVVVVIVVSLLQAVSRQEKLISLQRESQLRQEQLLSLGTAAAQFAHRLATPLGTVHLLTEELQESVNNQDPLINMLDEQLMTCRRHLDDFRLMAEQVRTNSKQPTNVSQIIEQLRQEVQLSFPLANVEWHITGIETQQVLSEPVLIPALLNLIQNAVNASKNNNRTHVSVSVSITSSLFILAVRDYGCGFGKDALLQLGVEMVDSKDGLGMGVFLSHVTLEQLNGTLKLSNHIEQGAIAEVTLPLVDQHND